MKETRDKAQVTRHKLQVASNLNNKFHSQYTLLLLSLTLSCYLLLATCYFLNTAHADVKNTRHNLSTSGPGPIRATSETRVCIFCHTPHGAVITPLWNHTLSPPGTPYDVPIGNILGDWYTLKSEPESTPDGDSRLCLSCHDGTVAIASIVNLGKAADNISMEGTENEKLPTTSLSYIGIKLSGDHPVSIEVNLSLINDKNIQCVTNEVSYGIIFPPKPIKLTPTDNRYGGSSTGVGVQCSSCHDAHEDTPKFLRMPPEGLFCESCHQLCQPSSNETHLDRSKLPLGCISCHKNHGATNTVMLKKPKDQLCFECHGNVKTGAPGEASTDIYSVLLKQSNHPVIQSTQYHYRGESLPERPTTTTTRHAACFDCHNPHLLTSSNPLNGARGYSGRGLQINRAQYEYQVCYKCHSDSYNLPPGASDIASKFEAGNAAFHPVETIGKNNNVPSLVASLSTVSIITCSDCHNNDDTSGAKGPHGSNYDYILSENYTMDTGAESPYAYELCYKCHRRSSILDDDSFQAHKSHLTTSSVNGVQVDASCFACHDAHGTLNYTNLINFDTTIVTPNSLGELNYLNVVSGKPRCFLTCHINSQTFEHKITGGLYCINSNCPPGW